MVVDTEVKENDETHEESDAVMADIAGDDVCNTSENVYEQSGELADIEKPTFEDGNETAVKMDTVVAETAGQAAMEGAEEIYEPAGEGTCSEKNDGIEYICVSDDNDDEVVKVKLFSLLIQ